MSIRADLIVTEGVESMWRYHLSDPGKPTVALCGKRVMRTGIPLSEWDRTPKGFHIPESWCGVCAQRGEPK